HGKIIGTEMEGAGVLHATFRQEFPTPAVVIKGISDAADKNKSATDTQGHWRELAKENSARLVLGLIGPGRVCPLLTDQFDMDTTPGSPADARAIIEKVAAPGVSYRAFPRLVVPKGPLTELHIGIEVYEADAPLAVNECKVRYTDREGNIQIKPMTGQQLTFYLREPIFPAPLGVYALIPKTPKRIRFTVSSPACTKTAEWVLHS